MSICVVVADASRARLLLAEDGNSTLIEYGDLVHPESRLREQDLVSDEVGNVFESAGPGVHGMGRENKVHRKEAEAFAREVCNEVERIRVREGLRRIYLVAPPRFLGQLRSAMNKQCAAMISGETNKDLVTLGIEEIRTHLPGRL